MNAWLEARTGLFLSDPWWLLLLFVAPLLWRRRGRGESAVGFAPARLWAGALPSSLRVRLLPLPRTLHLAALLAAVLALSRPVERVPLPREVAGIDILLCLDVSSSMLENDLDPIRTRLDLCKQAASRFIEGRAQDRIGLIRFARYPDLLCPLTLDHRALPEFLDQVEPVQADGPEDATGIGTAVARAAELLRHRESPSRVVILLTDGEENVASQQAPEEIAPLHAAQLCELLGVRVYSIALGTGRRDASGRFGPVDTEQVETLARRTGGAFFTARDGQAIEQVYAAIDQLETTRFEETRYRVEERFRPLLLLAIALLLARVLLEAAGLEALP